VHFIFERSEIIYIPGSYDVVLSELTKGIKLEIELPQGVTHRVKEWFDRGGEQFRRVGEQEYVLEDVVLPGQSVSVQFFRSN
jgi:hypothetical protein